MINLFSPPPQAIPPTPRDEDEGIPVSLHLCSGFNDAGGVILNKIPPTPISSCWRLFQHGHNWESPSYVDERRATVWHSTSVFHPHFFTGTSAAGFIDVAHYQCELWWRIMETMVSNLSKALTRCMNHIPNM